MGQRRHDLTSADPMVGKAYDDYDDEDDVIEEVVLSDDDEESFIEEEIIEEEEEEIIIEEEIIEEDDDASTSVELSEDDDDDDDDEADDTGSGDYLDDDSSAPPPSMSSDGLKFEEAGRGEDAVNLGARKAMEEQLAREKSIQRQAAREALQRKRLEQEAVKRKKEASQSQNQEQQYNNSKDPILQRPNKQPDESSARRRLIEEIRKVDLALSKKRDQVAHMTRIHGTAEVEKRKKALAELRRQAARNELARNNDKLKAAKASRSQSSASIKSSMSAQQPASSATSLIGMPPPSPAVTAPGQLLHQSGPAVADSIKSVAVPSLTVPISPLVGIESNHERRVVKPIPLPLSDGKRLDQRSQAGSSEQRIAGITSDDVMNGTSSSPIKTKTSPLERMPCVPPEEKTSRMALNQRAARLLERCSNASGEKTPLNSEASNTGTIPFSTSQSNNSNKKMDLLGRSDNLNSDGDDDDDDDGLPIAETKKTSYQNTKVPLGPVERDPSQNLTTTKPNGSLEKPLRNMLSQPSQPLSVTVEKQKPLSTSSNDITAKNDKGENEALYYSIEDLKEKRIEGLDYTRREQYLSPDDFEKYFKMKKEVFTKLPKWKRDKAKRELSLF